MPQDKPNDILSTSEGADITPEAVLTETIEAAHNNHTVRNTLAAAAVIGGAVVTYQTIRQARRHWPSRRYSDYKKLFADRELPFAYVDLDALNANIETILQSVGAKSIRINSKSIRSVALLKYIQAANPRFSGILCYSAPEAVYLAEQGLDDLLIAHPTWNEAHIEAVANMVRRGKLITLMVDSFEHVHRLEEIAERLGVTLPICLDLDVSSDYPGGRFGVWHSPIRSVRHAISIIDAVEHSNNVYLDGIRGYEAQIADIPDNVPGRFFNNLRLRILKRQSMREVMTTRAEVVAVLQTSGILLRFINGGGSGSLKATAKDPVISEVSVGGAFFAPHLLDHYKDASYQPAAGFALEIVRRAAHDIYTCLGGGYVASGNAHKDKLPKPYLPDGALLLDVEGVGEVQTPIRYIGSERLHLGDPIFMRHAKAGELCEHFNTLLLVSDGEIVDEVTTYRGDGQAFL